MTQHEEPDARRPQSADSSDDSDGDFGHSDNDRTSRDIRRDQEILQGEEEAERLLSGQQRGTDHQRVLSEKDAKRAGKHEAKREKREIQREKREAKREKRRLQRGGRKEGESELMYEMEEGHKDSSDSSGHSSEVDRMNLGEIRAPKPVCGPKRGTNHYAK